MSTDPVEVPRVSALAVLTALAQSEFGPGSVQPHDQTLRWFRAEGPLPSWSSVPDVSIWVDGHDATVMWPANVYIGRSMRDVVSANSIDEVLALLRRPR